MIRRSTSSSAVYPSALSLAIDRRALADVLTIEEEFGSLEIIKIAWIGDSNNVSASLVEIAAMLGLHLVISSPEGYRFSQEEIATLTQQRQPGFELEFIDNPKDAVSDAHVVYTDVWVSMGEEAEKQERLERFASYQVNAELMKNARKDAIFLHCLPARRGLEVTDDVIDSPQSRVVAEAENRMHAQKGLLVWLLQD